MRTLTRPMFNMGGPIKQGVMHGIREPYKHGTRAALVGNPVYPKTGGREHHVAPLVVAGGINAARWLGTLGARKLAQKGIQESVKRAAGAGAGGWKNLGQNWFSGDPTVKGAKWGWKTLTSPTANTLAQKTAKSIFSPTGIGLTGLYFANGKWFNKKGEEVNPPTGIEKPGGYPVGPEAEEVKVLSQAAKDAFAKSQREKRVQKYLDMMGYDRSKKTAIADALIDASKIVGDRGSLEAKNITQELINPIIQATSKRLDKPQQIREAVGLMSAKAEIEKDLSKETDALKTRGLELQILNAENTLAESSSFEGGLRKFINERKGKVDKVTLERISRLLANEHNEPFIKTEEGTVASGDGIYMIDGGIFRVTDGVEKQLA